MGVLLALITMLCLLGSTAAAASRVEPSLLYSGRAYDAFPGAVRLPGGELLVSFRTASGHIAADGRIMLARSSDAGASWKVSTLYDDRALDDRSHVGLTRLSDGRLLLPFYKHDGTPGGVTGSFITISRDRGRSWSPPRRIDRGSPGWLAAYGRILERPKRTLLLAAYGPSAAVLLRSTDGGLRWRRRSVIGPLSETTLVALGSRHLMAVGRYAFGGQAVPPDGSSYLYAVHSRDDGRSWGRPRRLFPGIAPDVIRLRDGRLLLCAADRITHTVRCRTSERGWRWSEGVVLYSAAGEDFGYPTSVELPGRKVLTAFYDDAGDILTVAYPIPGV